MLLELRLKMVLGPAFFLAQNLKRVCIQYIAGKYANLFEKGQNNIIVICVPIWSISLFFLHIELWNLPKIIPYDVQFSHLFFIIYHLTIPPIFRIMSWKALKALKAAQHLTTPGSAQYHAMPNSNPFCIYVIIMNPINGLLGGGLSLFHASLYSSWLTIPHFRYPSIALTSQNVIIFHCFSIKCQVRIIRMIHIDECISEIGFTLHCFSVYASPSNIELKPKPKQVQGECKYIIS